MQTSYEDALTPINVYAELFTTCMEGLSPELCLMVALNDSVTARYS
jgi:hypothetical protein